MATTMSAPSMSVPDNLVLTCEPRSTPTSASAATAEGVAGRPDQPSVPTDRVRTKGIPASEKA